MPILHPGLPAKWNGIEEREGNMEKGVEDELGKMIEWKRSYD